MGVGEGVWEELGLGCGVFVLGSIQRLRVLGFGLRIEGSERFTASRAFPDQTQS